MYHAVVHGFLMPCTTLDFVFSYKTGTTNWSRINKMPFSTTAINDLRRALHKSCGEPFESSLSENEVAEIGGLLLTILAESLKNKAVHPELYTNAS